MKWTDILKRKFTYIPYDRKETYRQAKSAEIKTAQNALDEARKALETRYMDDSKRRSMELELKGLEAALDAIKAGPQIRGGKRDMFQIEDQLEEFSKELAYFYEKLEYGTDSQRQADFVERIKQFPEETVDRSSAAYGYIG